MSQVLPTDFPIDPTTTDGVELADILNRFYSATQSSNSGATAPGSTYSGQIWLDTSTSADGIVRIRNAANNGWITIGAPGTQTMMPDGQVLAPGLAWTSELTLGWYRPGAGRVGMSFGGAQRYEFTANSLMHPDGVVATPSMSFLSEAGLGLYRAAAGTINIAQGGNATFTFISSAPGVQQIIQAYGANASATLGLAARGNGGNAITAFKGVPGGATLRWQMLLGDAAAEGGANAGSDFSLACFSDTGVSLATPMKITRSNGTVTFPGLVNLGPGSKAAPDFNVASRLILGAITGLPGQVIILKASGATVGSISAGQLSGGVDDCDISGLAKLNFWCNGLHASVNNAGEWRYLTPIVKFPAIGTGVAVGSNAYFEPNDENRVYRTTSSLRYKKDVEPMDPAASAFIYELAPIWFRMIEDALDPSWSYYGLAAEEVAALEPRFAHFAKDENGESRPEGVQYDRLIVPAIMELKKLRDRVAQLEAK